MLVNIDKIIIKDRIRKDLGDLQELADDIQEHTLLNPIVVAPSGEGNGTYALIAGERRLRACKLLGYKAITINSVGAEDAEEALMMEISENECRKSFTKTERLDYARKLARIEAAKAKERMQSGKAQDPTANLPQGETRDIVASQLGASATQIRREQFIEDNRDLLDPTDFVDWDEGKLSTNKAYQKIRAAKERAEKERDEARQQLDSAEREVKSSHSLAETYKSNLEDAYKEIEALEQQNDQLYERASQKAEPKVVERKVEVVREVVPEDTQRRIEELEHDCSIYVDTNQTLRRQLEDTRRELDRANILIGEKERNDSASWDIRTLTTATNNYLRQYGGKAWAFDQFYRVDEVTQQEFVKAITNLAAFAQNLAQLVSEKQQ